MENEQLEKVMERLLEGQNEDNDNFLHDLMLRARDIHADVDQDEKDLTSWSDMDRDTDVETNTIVNMLQQVYDAKTNVYSAVNNLENELTDAKLQTSAFANASSGELRNLKKNFHQAPTCFGNQSLRADNQALSEEINKEDQQLFDGKRIDNDLEVEMKEVASSDLIYAWTPHFNDMTAERSEAKEMICAAEYEISQLDDQLKKFTRC